MLIISVLSKGEITPILILKDQNPKKPIIVHRFTIIYTYRILIRNGNSKPIDIVIH